MTFHAVQVRDGQVWGDEQALLGTGVTPASRFVQGLPLAEDHSLTVDAHLQAAAGLWDEPFARAWKRRLARAFKAARNCVKEGTPLRLSEKDYLQ